MHIGAVVTSKNEGASDAGYVYTWGLNADGRLGLNSENENLNSKFFNFYFFKGEENIDFKTVPSKIFTIPDKVTRISCGSDFTACLTKRGHLYTWGNNRSGNLGVDFENKNPLITTNNKKIIDTPTLVKSLTNKFITQVFNFCL